MTKYLTPADCRKIHRHWLAISPIDATALQWKTLSEFPNYQISEWGHLRRVTIATRRYKQPGILKPRVNNTGRIYYSLQKNNKEHRRYAHRLVLESFIGPAPSLQHECAHFDDDAVNNHYSNLRWATRLENDVDKQRNGKTTRGKKSPHAVLTESLVKKIRASSKRTYEIAKDLGIEWATIAAARKRKTWAWVQ